MSIIKSFDTEKDRRSVSMNIENIPELKLDDINSINRSLTNLSKNNKAIVLKKSFSNAHQRNDEFKKLFKELPSNEFLLADFSCSLLKDVLLQGRLFITLHNICFRSTILNWETVLVINFKDVKSIEKNKLKANAIKIRLPNEKFQFMNLSTRDKVVEILTKIWEKELQNDPLTDSELKSVLKNVLGEDLEDYSEKDEIYNSEESNKTFGHQKFTSREAKTANLTKASSCMTVNKIGSTQIPLTSNSVLANNSSSPEIELKKNRLNGTHSQHNLDSEFISTTADTPTTRLNSQTSNKSIVDGPNDTFIYNFDTSTPRDCNQFKMDTTTSSDSIKLEENITCSCVEHKGRELLNQTFDFSPNFIFTCIFGESDFSKTYRYTRGFRDEIVSEWKVENGIPVRAAEYKVINKSALGPKFFKNKETFKLLEYKRNQCIVVESFSETSGMPYTDYFSIIVRFCMTRVGKTNRTNLRTHNYINYYKKPIGFIKTFIEKNTYSALEDNNKYLDKKLSEIKENPSDTSIDISAVKCLEKTQETTMIESNPVVNLEEPKAENPNPRRKLKSSVSESSIKSRRSHKRNKSHTESFTKSNSETKNIQHNSNQNIVVQTFTFMNFEINIDTLVRIFIIATLFLMMLNGILYFKIVRIENLANALHNQAKDLNLEQNIIPDINEKALSLQEEFIITAKAIIKMGDILTEWTKNYENFTSENNLSKL